MEGLNLVASPTRASAWAAIGVRILPYTRQTHQDPLFSSFPIIPNKKYVNWTKPTMRTWLTIIHWSPATFKVCLLLFFTREIIMLWILCCTDHVTSSNLPLADGDRGLHRGKLSNVQIHQLSPMNITRFDHQKVTTSKWQSRVVGISPSSTCWFWATYDFFPCSNKITSKMRYDNFPSCPLLTFKDNQAQSSVSARFHELMTPWAY